MSNPAAKQHHVVIVGGGFGGLYAAQALGNCPGITVTLVDKRNFHLFQPLLYQVATGGLSPADIASPLRAVLRRYTNIRIELGEAVGIDSQNKTLLLKDGEITYDKLILATGGLHHYFGNDQWAERAPGLKTIEDALEIRRRVFMAFENAERETDPKRCKSWLTFIIVGGGPTGVELAGALAELAHQTLKNDFRTINLEDTNIILLEGTDRVLPPYPAELSEDARQRLESLGVSVRINTLVTDIQGDQITVKHNDQTETIYAQTTLWAAGVKASGLGKALCDATQCQTDRAGRIIVDQDLSVPGHADIFVIGDLASYSHTPDGKPLPGIAPVAMQQGAYTAQLLKARLNKKTMAPFEYKHHGNLAVIGRNAAVAEFGNTKLTGFFAWIIWAFVHIRYLIEFENQMLVMVQWGWSYFTRNQGARLITGETQPYDDTKKT